MPLVHRRARKRAKAFTAGVRGLVGGGARERKERKERKELEERIERSARKMERRLEREMAAMQATLLKALERFDASRPPEGVGRLDYDGADIELRVRSRLERSRLHAVRKEPWTARWLDEWVRPGECVFDVGANVGAYALVAARGPARARAVAFEPGFATFATLCENVVVNGAGEEVTPLPLALSDSTGLSTFNYSDMQSGAAFHGLGPDATAVGKAGAAPVGAHHVLSCRLDDAVEWLGLPAPNHLKVDVDGSEIAVLRGAPRALGADGMRTVMIEVSEEARHEVSGLLGGAGLELERTYDTGRGEESTSPRYELWARPGA